MLLSLNLILLALELRFILGWYIGSYLYGMRPSIVSSRFKYSGRTWPLFGKNFEGVIGGVFNGVQCTHTPAVNSMMRT